MSTTMEAVETIETERAQFEEWAQKQWNAFTIAERAQRFERANERVKELWEEDEFGLVLLAGGILPWNINADGWRDAVRALVVEHLWYDWNRMQVVAGGLIGTDNEIGSAAAARMVDEYPDLTDAIERGGELNHVVTYYVHPSLSSLFKGQAAAS